MKKIFWCAQHQPIARQKIELKKIFGQDVQIWHQWIRNARQIADAFRKSGALEIVLLSPLATMEHVLKQGLFPLWVETEQVAPDHPQAEIGPIKSRWFRFVKFSRLRAIGLEYEKKLQPLKKVGRILWLSRHEIQTETKAEIRRLYGETEIRKVVHQGNWMDARKISQLLKDEQAGDVVLVAPLSVFDALCKQGIKPIQVKLSQGHQTLRRVKRLRKEFEELD